MARDLNKIILIIGGSGYYGSELARSLGLSKVLKSYYKNKNQDGIFFDLASSKVSDVLIEYPNIRKVVISAGMTGSSIIDNDPEKAQFYNVTCIKRIIDELDKLNLIPVFISSDSVFDGKKGNYVETDKTNPRLMYGVQKDIIEKYIVNKFTTFQILRLSKIFDSDLKGNTLVANWIKKLDQNENIYCANDNIFSPIHLNDLCEVSKRIIDNNCSGIYHVCSSVGLNRKDMFRKVLDYYSQYKNYSGKIHYMPLNEIPGAKNHPLNTSMSLKKTISEVNFLPKSFSEWAISIIKQRFHYSVMKWIKETEEIFYFSNSKSVKVISKDDLKSLKILASSNKRNRVRICTHKNIRSDIHEMFIYHPKGTYIRPHKHILKNESFHLICGKIDFVTFDKIGNITEVLPMGNYISGKTFYYRISPDIFHTQIFLEDTIFHEVTKGPFKKEDTVFADWSPDENDITLVENYFIKIREYST